MTVQSYYSTCDDIVKYGSMYNPKHPTADDKGLRRDFIDALKGTGLPVVRMSSGDFVSGWDWKDCLRLVNNQTGSADRPIK